MNKQMKSRYTIWLPCTEMEELLSGVTVSIKEKQHHYIMSIIRLRQNDYLTCISENGVLALTHIVEQQKSHTVLALISYHIKERPQYHVILALAGSKQIRRSFLLEKCVEVGIQELWIWNADHSQGNVQIKDSWYDVLYNASTQCKNPFIPTMHSFSSLEDMLSHAENTTARMLLFYEDTIYSQPTTIAEWDAISHPLVLIIGCEGGFSEREVQLAQKKNIPLRSLGSHILRFETAGIVACSTAIMLNDNKGIKL